MIGSGLPAMHISRTEGHFQAALRVVDLATGDEVAILTLRADPGKQNESQTGSPEYPAASDLVDIATRQAIEQTRHLYTRWNENQELVFMDDKECNLRQSWDLLKAGDYSGLLLAARTNEEGDTCARVMPEDPGKDVASEKPGRPGEKDVVTDAYHPRRDGRVRGFRAALHREATSLPRPTPTPKTAVGRRGQAA